MAKENFSRNRDGGGGALTTLLLLGGGAAALYYGADFLLNGHVGDSSGITGGSGEHSSDVTIYPPGHYPDYGHNGVPKYGIVPPEHPTDPSGWGPYYNQRDAYWGNLALNGQHQYPVWEYGCYASAYAMIAAHYGVHVGADNHLITPADVARNSRFFDPHHPQLMYAKEPIPGHSEALYSLTGKTPQQDIAFLQTQLKEGHQILLGMHNAKWDSDHFVVVKGIMKHSDGEIDLVINDPDHPNAMNVPLSAYYLFPTWKMVEAKVYS